jgi:hypothetical protein
MCCDFIAVISLCSNFIKSMESLKSEETFVDKIASTAQAHFKRSEVIRQEITSALK